GYMGYSWNPNLLTLTTGVIVSAVLALFLPLKAGRASDLAIVLLFGKSLIAILVLPSSFSALNANELITFQMTIAVGFLLICAMNRLPPLRLSFRIFSHQGYELLLFGLATIMLIPIVVYFGVPSTLPGFGEVYDIRFSSRSTFASSPAIVGYL